MIGCWVTWPAELRSRPDIADVGPHLDRAVEALRRHRDIEDAGYDHDEAAHVVTWRLRVRFGPLDQAMVAQTALYESLRSVGIGPNVVAVLRLQP